MIACPLCFNEVFSSEIKGPSRQLFHYCENCRLVFSEKQDLPNRQNEKERYLKHENSIQNKGYVRHLNQAIHPALPYLRENMRGLDYGCGPVPTLNRLLEKKGLNCEFYDPIFFPEHPLGRYDYIFATECFEHFFSPDAELHKLTHLLESGGILIVMTTLWEDIDKFEAWKYAQDPTHVVFYHQKTFEFICAKYGFELLANHNNRVIILRKQNGNASSFNFRCSR